MLLTMTQLQNVSLNSLVNHVLRPKPEPVQQYNWSFDEKTASRKYYKLDYNKKTSKMGH